MLLIYIYLRYSCHPERSEGSDEAIVLSVRLTGPTGTCAPRLQKKHAPCESRVGHEFTRAAKLRPLDEPERASAREESPPSS
jgi:hypothetical protein